MENFNTSTCAEKRERLRVCLLLYIGTGSIQSQCVRHFAMFAPDRQVISERVPFIVVEIALEYYTIHAIVYKGLSKYNV